MTPMTEEQIKDLLNRISHVFTPESPVTDRQVFFGRYEVIEKTSEVIERRGAHMALFGNRGVGKTSLANILKITSGMGNKRIIFYTSCDSNDSYESLWRKTLGDFVLHQPDNDDDDEIALAQEVYPNFGASDIASILRVIGDSAVIFFDEFDRLNEFFDRRLFADTLKSMSDGLPDTTVIIVGVAKDIIDLIGEHPSVGRNLIEVELKEMSEEEIRGIISNGVELLGMTMEEDVVGVIVSLSCGYPHFAHLLALHACRSAAKRGRKDVKSSPDLGYAITTAARESDGSLRTAYINATGNNRETLYERVLWAAASAEWREDGTFQAKDLIAPLSQIMGKAMKYQSFNSHLADFTTPERGQILDVSGGSKRKRYKFIDPRLRAYILIKFYEFKKEQTREKPTDLFGEGHKSN